MSLKQAPDSGSRWLDQPANVDRIVRGLIAACVLLVVADLLYHKHVHYGFERWFGFYGFYGFISCVLLVRAAVVLRKWVMRSEDYYEPTDEATAAPCQRSGEEAPSDG